MNELLDFLADASDLEQQRWASLFDDGAPVNDDAPRQGRPQRLGTGIVPQDEDEDAEHPAAAPRGRPHLQRAILARLDAQVRHDLRARHESAGNATAVRRLDELSHPDTNHEWLWALSCHRGPLLDASDYVEAVRVRVGAAGPSEPVPCNLCGCELLDSAGAHALCCSRAEATKGHHALARQVYDTAKICDPATEFEEPGLIPGTRLRPADVLIGALGHGLTALDIGIASPDACNAGPDCVASMYARKIGDYAPYSDVLDRQNILYQPLIWSVFGRPQPPDDIHPPQTREPPLKAEGMLGRGVAVPPLDGCGWGCAGTPRRRAGARLLA